MSVHDIILPKLGESVTDATLTKWLVKEGDVVKYDQVVAEVATDKVDSEVYADNSGTVSKLLFKENEVIQVGEAILTLSTESNGQQSNVEKPKQSLDEPKSVKQKNSTDNTPRAQNTNAKKTNFFLSPLVTSIIQQNNVPHNEIENIVGSGVGGRITKKDILGYINKRKQDTQQSIQDNISKDNSSNNDASVTNDTIIQKENNTTLPNDHLEYKITEMDRVRKMIATRMKKSIETSAHVTSFSEADVTDLVQWRSKNKKPYHEKYGLTLTLTHLFVEIVSKALLKFPLLNSSIDGDKILVYKSINIGVAVALKNNNLIVPVLRNVTSLNLQGIVRGTNDLIEKARNNSLTSDYLSGGTFTLSNIGGFGSMMGTPIINQPQVAILAIGYIKKRPSVIKTNYGEIIVPRDHLHLSLSYDHRIIDGALGSLFLKELVQELENFDTNKNV